LDDILKQGIAAYRSGNFPLARQLLYQVVRDDPYSIPGWLWLSAVVENDAEKRECLENILKIDHNNLTARKGLEKLDAQQQAAPSAEVPLSALFASQDEPEETPAAATQKPEGPATQLTRELSGGDEPLPPEETGQVDDKDKGKKKAKPSRWLVLGVIAIVGCLCLGGAFLALQSYITSMLSPQNIAAVTPVNYNAEATLFSPTPTLTPTISPTATQTFTITPLPTKTATPTATFPPANPTIVVEMDRIEQQVSDLRGLPITGEVSAYVIPNLRAKELLLEQILTDEVQTELDQQQVVLSKLGLIKPTYSLENAALNHIVDNIGGFYQPWSKEIFVLGIWFRGMEHYIYSHEYDHALVDMTYNFEQMELDAGCIHNSQRCQAMDALIEGDATLLMNQWLVQYATPQDYQDLINYRPPLMALPEEFPPPYVVEEVNFAYGYGFQFVKFLHDRGNWAEVNNAYTNPPTTTEQILHPEKYLTGEQAIPVDDPHIVDLLGEGWEEYEYNSLGEWTTYLLLGFGADYAAQVNLDNAEGGAAGWGGDRYQVAHNPTSGQTVLTAHWVWESLNDAQEFLTNLKYSQNERFRGNVLSHPTASCWEMNGETSCIFAREEQTLWIIAPDLNTVEKVLTQYPFFQ